MKILAIRTHSLGDMVIQTPAFRRLYEGFNSGQIDLLTSSYGAPAIKGLPFFTNVYQIELDWLLKPTLSGLLKLNKVMSSIRKEKYDLAVVFHIHKAIIGLPKYAGIKEVFSYATQSSPYHYAMNDGELHALNPVKLANKAIAKHSNKALNEFPPELLKYEWVVSEEEQMKVEEILTENGLKKGQFIVMFPAGGKNPRVNDTVKRWGNEKFEYLIRSIYQKNELKTVLLGAKFDMEDCKEIARNVDEMTIDLSGKFDLRITAALIEKASVAITNDSAPLHVSLAVGTHTVGIFGPTGFMAICPPMKNFHPVSLNLKCSPCYYSTFSGCIYKSIKCMEDLDVQTVSKVFDKALKASKRDSL